MTEIVAYHLPGLRPEAVDRWSIREYDDAVRLRVPVLTPAALGEVIASVREARARHLAERPVERIVEAIDGAARRLEHTDSPERRLLEDTLPAVTGYSAPMIRLVLERMVADWRADALRRLLHDEFGDSRVLDEFRPRPGRSDGPLVRAFGPELAFHIFAGNVPGVAVTSLVRSLLVKAATLGKAASGDPLLPAIFAQLLAEVDPELGACLAVTYWTGGDEALEGTVFDVADAVVVYGGEAVVESVRERIPLATRLIEHGPRLSLAIVGREALSRERVEETAARAARAVATFDQQGCVSPHLIYAERGGEIGPEAFAGRLYTALEQLAAELPRGPLSAAEAATIHQLRGAAEFRALAGEETRIFASRGTEQTVIYEADPTFAASCLNRLVRVKPLDSLEGAVDLLRPFARYLQTVGVEATRERAASLAESFGRVGASRITGLEGMPWPAPSWHHDGQEPLRELVRWTDLEPGGP